MANVSTLSDPTFITRDSTNNLGISALDARLGVSGLADPSAASTFGFSSGVFPGSSSGTTILDCRVIQATSANMTVQVSFGNYQCGRSGLGAYLGAVTGNTSATVSGSNGSNPRIDYVVLRVREPTVDGTVTASAQVLVLPGSPAANPTEATAAGQMADGDCLLAAVTVRAGTSSILQSDISDRRVYVKARGGIGVKSAVDNSVGSYPGEWRDNPQTVALERWSGSAWQAVATPAEWNQTTVALYSGGSTNTAGNTQVSLGSGSTVARCRYIAVGKVLNLQFDFDWGTAPYNGGIGDISTRLPAGYYARALGGDQALLATLYVPAGSSTWFGKAYVRANSNVVFITFPISTNDCRHLGYRIATTQSTSGGSVPYMATGFPEGGGLSISGAIECA